MKVGLHLSSFTNEDQDNFVKELDTVAKMADKGGMGLLTVMDHYFQIPYVGQIDESMFEGYSVLNYIAGKTHDIKLSTMVTGVIYRNPGFLAKQVSTLDVLSQGRAMLGIGASWFEREAVGLGFGFPSLKERFEMLEETLQIVKQIWSDDNGPFEGKHYQMKETRSHPKTVQLPHPPILIGGGGEKKTLKFVAKYATACNLFAQLGHDQLKHKLNVLKSHCKAVERDYNDIMITTTGSIKKDTTADELLKELKDLSSLGVDHAHFSIQDVYDLDLLTMVVDEIVPAIADW